VAPITSTSSTVDLTVKQSDGNPHEQMVPGQRSAGRNRFDSPRMYGTNQARRGPITGKSERKKPQHHDNQWAHNPGPATPARKRPPLGGQPLRRVFWAHPTVSAGCQQRFASVNNDQCRPLVKHANKSPDGTLAPELTDAPNNNRRKPTQMPISASWANLTNEHLTSAS